MSGSFETGKKIFDSTRVLVGEVADTEEGQEAKRELGKSALTLTRAVNNVLLPIAAVNFGFDKARKYFEEKFEAEFKEATKSIAEDQLIEPNASIAAPALEGLAFSHEQKVLKRLYLSLLATAVDRKNASRAHPAFVEIIKQLSSDDAILLENIIPLDRPLPILKIIVKHDNSGSKSDFKSHILNTINKETGKPTIVENLATTIDNWNRLGLTETTYKGSLTAKGAYDFADTRPELIQAKTTQPEMNFAFEKGYIQLTDFGKSFKSVVSQTA